ncbi:MAG: hypothetical protein R6X12_02040 [bacterium]
MKRSMLVLVPALILVAGLFLTGCDRAWSDGDVVLNVDPAECGTPQEVILYAGQHINAGNVTVWNDATNLYVQFNSSGDWVITETHVAVATSLAGIPQKNGNPVPGLFPYKEVHDPAVTTYTYTIPLGDWEPGQELYIAAHASMALLDEYGEVIQTETGWGYGPDFPGRNWATYLMYEVQDCEEPIGMEGLFRTQTQGGWGAVPQGGNPGAYLHANFAGAFPGGLVMGGDYTLTLTDAQAVTDYLPDGGTPVALTQDWVDPGNQAISVLAGQVTALSLSVGFDLYDPDFGADPVNLKDLVVADLASPYYGWTVQEVLDEANAILGGGPGNPSQINDAVSAINENFVDGTIDNGFLAKP